MLTKALEDCERLHLHPGEVLLRPGQSNDSIYIILCGKVVVRLQSEGAVDTCIPIPEGHCIGEFSAIDGKPASALVEAESEALLLHLPQRIFWSRLVGLPGVARNMMRTLTERTRLTNQMALQAQRERLELEQLRRELELARDLQTSMLPLRQPMFPNRADIEICGLVEPADTVGGDFFDAFLLDEHRLFVCVGDVSGHGIAAALLMARTIGLLRILAITEASPAKVLGRLNDSLAEGNDTAAFATVFCGCLDLTSGSLTYSNAGHSPPLLAGAGGTGPIPLPPGMLVGPYPARRYRDLCLDLAPGEVLLLYTDGITEAESGNGEAFGQARCLEVLERERERDLPGLMEAMREAVGRFRGRRSLEDDGTLLVLRRPWRPVPDRREKGGPARRAGAAAGLAGPVDSRPAEAAADAPAGPPPEPGRAIPGRGTPCP